MKRAKYNKKQIKPSVCLQYNKIPTDIPDNEAKKNLFLLEN